MKIDSRKINHLHYQKEPCKQRLSGFFTIFFFYLGREEIPRETKYNSNKSGIVPVFDFTLQIIG